MGGVTYEMRYDESYRSSVAKVEEKSSTTFYFSLSPGFLSFLTEKVSPFLYGKFQNKEQ
jgi:hypothetical protein